MEALVPHIFGEGGGRLFVEVIEGLYVSPVPGFEVAFCEPDVVLSFILTCDSGVVYYASGCAALSVKGAGTFHAVAVSRFVVDQLHVTIQNFIVVALN